MYELKVIPGYAASAPGIQIGSKLSEEIRPEDITFLKQIGVEWVMVDVKRPENRNAAGYRNIRERIEEAGLRVYRMGNSSCHNMEEITLGLPGRDEKLEEYLQYIRDLGEAGIKYATYAHMANGIWSSERESMRGGAVSRAFRLDKPSRGRWIEKFYEGPLTHGREYSEEELWEHYEYFISKVVPVAEEAGVFIGIHPDDPPVYPLGGIPRSLFGTFEGYKRAIETAGSPHIGVCLCVGCWLEGGELMGADVLEALRYFGERKKLFKLHFRNVSCSIPEGGFAEAFIDDGYMDMAKIIALLHELEYDGCVMSDHLPGIEGGARAAEALSVGYIRGLIHSVQG